MYELELAQAIRALSTRDEWVTFVDGWLDNRRLAANTRAAYRSDLHQWLAHCETVGLKPLAATFIHINTYARGLESEGLSPASVARKLSGVSAWYVFLVKVGAIAANPVRDADRPKVSRDHSKTVGLAAVEVDAILAASRRNTRNHAMMLILADLGLRVSEVCDLDMDSVAVHQGRMVLQVTGKGGKFARRPLTSETVAALKLWLAVRGEASGPLFVSEAGNRLDRHRVADLVQEYARSAGLSHWRQITPHSLRHAFATASRDEGVPLEDVQDAMGHADPRTTRRYDRDRHNLDRDPASRLAAARERRRNSPTMDS